MPLSTSLHNKLETSGSHHGRWRSLAPHRNYATPVDQLCCELIDTDIDSSIAAAFAQGIAQTTQAIAEHFPDNIFADLDFLAAALLNHTRRRANEDPQISATSPSQNLTELFARIVQLIELYGRHSAIRFRYAHDFLYGFDWARWVDKSPLARSAVGPFDIEFLDYLHKRGTELLALIYQGDSKYPPLPSEQWRNHFSFSRAPADEAQLYLELATDGLVPVAGWDPLALPVFDRDFHKLRQARADRLYGQK
jgi:hypothetical protein